MDLLPGYETFVSRYLASVETVFEHFGRLKKRFFPFRETFCSSNPGIS
jgi:hypothetical protein